MNKTTCVYCETERDTKTWEQTGESVCYECRLDLLNQEFAELFTKRTKTVQAQDVLHLLFS